MLWYCHSCGSLIKVTLHEYVNHLVPWFSQSSHFPRSLALLFILPMILCRTVTHISLCWGVGIDALYLDSRWHWHVIYCQHKIPTRQSPRRTSYIMFLDVYILKS